MVFINELKRYWLINLKNPRKSILPLAFNIIVILLLYLLFQNISNQTYIFSYSIMWLLLTSQLSMMQDFSIGKKTKIMKYFFCGKRTLVGVYLSRYIISSTKYSILFFAFFKLIETYQISFRYKTKKEFIVNEYSDGENIYKKLSDQYEEEIKIYSPKGKKIEEIYGNIDFL